MCGNLSPFHHLTPPPAGYNLVFCVHRLTHDISLEEFEDEDLSEITDECGISLQCKDALSLRVRGTGGRVAQSPKGRRGMQEVKACQKQWVQ